jgi:hypothetical protein
MEPIMKKTTLIFVFTFIAIFGSALCQNDKKQDLKPALQTAQAQHQPSTTTPPAPPPPAVETPDSPKLEFIGLNADTYDWKDVSPKDTPLKAFIVLKNTGKTKLIIYEVKPGCGCTTAPLSHDTIAPGDTASLSVTLNIGGNQNSVQKTVRVTSNEPKSPRLLLLKANVVHPIQILPTQYFAFGPLQVGQEDTSSVKIKNNSNTDITFSNFEVSPVTVNSNLNKPIILKPGEDFKIAIKVKPEKAGSYQMQVKMKTTHPDYPTFSVAGYGTVKESPIFQNK